MDTQWIWNKIFSGLLGLFSTAGDIYLNYAPEIRKTTPDIQFLHLLMHRDLAMGHSCLHCLKYKVCFGSLSTAGYFPAAIQLLQRMTGTMKLYKKNAKVSMCYRPPSRAFLQSEAAVVHEQRTKLGTGQEVLGSNPPFVRFCNRSLLIRPKWFWNWHLFFWTATKRGLFSMSSITMGRIHEQQDTILKSDNTFLRKPFSLCFLLTISSPLDWQETSHILFKLFPKFFGEYAPWVTILIDINTAISLLPSQKGFVSTKWRNLLTLQSLQIYFFCKQTTFPQRHIDSQDEKT